MRLKEPLISNEFVEGTPEGVEVDGPLLVLSLSTTCAFSLVDFRRLFVPAFGTQDVDKRMSVSKK